MKLNRGLIFMSDTRTNAGVDNISKFRKMFSWAVPDERAIVLMTAGNLATTQAVVSQIDERIRARSASRPSVFELPTVFQIAREIGSLLRETIRESTPAGQKAETFQSSMILGGQIKGSEPRLFMIYPEGNFIEASDDTPFFQIGETKYGRPILVRAYDKAMSFEDAVKLMIVSFDSTIKANLSVGLPLDLQMLDASTGALKHGRRVSGDDPYYQTISEGWSEALRGAFLSLPSYKF